MAPRRAAGRGFLMGKRGGAPKALLAAALCASAAVLLLLPTALGAGAWTVPEVVSYPDALSRPPRLALDSDGNVHATWSGMDEITDERVFYSNNIGGEWSEPASISDALVNSELPEIALDSDGKPHIVWIGKATLASEEHVYYSTNAGGGWSAPADISVAIPVMKTEAPPQIALDPGGYAHIVWRGGEAPAYTIYYSDNAGGAWSAPQSISSNNCFEPQIAADSSGDSHATWNEQEGLYYSKNTGGSWSVPENISSTTGRGQRMALDAGGNPHVTWFEWDGVADNIYYSKNNGDGWTAQENLSPGSTENTNPRIALDSAGNPRVTWYGNGGSELNVYYSENNGDGWTAQENLSPDSTGNSEPQIALDSAGNPHVAWRGNEGSALRIFHSKNPGDGWTKPQVVSQTVTDNFDPQIAVDAAGISHVMWQGGHGDFDVVYYSADNAVVISATADPPAGGTVTGSRNYKGGETVNLRATPNAEYRFVNWTEDGGFVSSSPDLSFKALDDRTLVANFALKTYNVNASVEPDARGNVSPLSQIVKHGSKATIKLMPDPGCRVTSIKDNGAAKPIPSDTESASYYVIDKVKENHNVVVDFAPVPKPTWYLAEGTTAWGFSTYISIQNPNPSAVTAKVTLMPRGGANANETITLAPNSQTTLSNDYLASKLAGEKDFSTRVEAGDKTKSIAVDRTMEWTGPGAASPEAHSSIGVTSPARTWYLPEGSTDWGFETWLLIQNPGDKEASCDITYMIEGKGPQTVNHKVPARSRESFSMADDIGRADASIKVDSNVPVIPERAMYRYDRREGHDSIGTTTPAKDYYLAEGAVGYPSDYTTWVLVQNPQGTTNNVTITYQTGSGEVKGPSFTMKPNTRATVRANDTLPPGTDVSTRVKGSAPLIAERAMYWSSSAGEACHDSIGTSTPARVTYLPDGQTSNGRETWTLVQNPHGIPVEIRVSYLPEGGGTPVSFTSIVMPNSRKTFNMADKIPDGRASIVVESIMGGPVICERAMYWSDRAAGTDTIGGFSN